MLSRLLESNRDVVSLTRSSSCFVRDASLRFNEKRFDDRCEIDFDNCVKDSE